MTFALVVTLLGLAGLGAIYVAESGLWPFGVGATQTVELRFPRDLAPAAVVDVLRGLSGLPLGSQVVLDVSADRSGVRHFLSASPATVASVRSGLRASVPALRAVPVEPGRGGRGRYTRGVRWRLVPRGGALRDADAERVGAGLLAALQPLSTGERLLVRWVVGPGRWRALPKPASGRRGARDLGLLAELLHDAGPTADRLRALRHKQSEPALRARVVVAAAAGHPKRAEHLLGRVSTVLRSVATPHGRLEGRRVSAATRLLRRPGLGLRPDLLSAAELAGLLGWPAGDVRLPGVSTGAAPLRLADAAIAERGRRVARANWPGQERDLCLSVPGALSHALVAGPTGSGKSVLALRGIVDELAAGRGVLVLDGRGDLAEDVLAAVPKQRADDVIVLDPGAGGPLPGLRLFGRGDDPELLADVVLGVFADLFSDSWGPRSELYLRLGLLTLAHDPVATLADFPFLFSEAAYRRRLVGRLRDPLLTGTWASFEAMGTAERAHVLAAPLNKIMSVIGRRSLRAILAQPKPAVDLAGVMARGQVLIVNLAPGAGGAPAARLLGALVVHALYAATQARARVAPSRRRPFFAFIDEPQVLAHLPVPLDTLLQQARGLGVGLTVAVQSVEALPRDVRHALLTNAATVVAFRQGADDARLLARELDGVAAEDLQVLGQFEVAARLGLGDGAVSAPVTALTFPPPPLVSDPIALRRASAQRYGVDPAEVDAALFARHKHWDESPIGRMRRQP
jgi:hypothetical protein